MLLVEAVATLLQGSISQSMLRRHKGLLSITVSNFYFTTLKGTYMTANLHNLLHLPENFGPLLAYLCFPFKSQKLMENCSSL